MFPAEVMTCRRAELHWLTARTPGTSTPTGQSRPFTTTAADESVRELVAAADRERELEDRLSGRMRPVPE